MSEMREPLSALLADINGRLTHVETVDDLVGEILALVERVVELPCVGIYLLDPTRDQLTLAGHKGLARRATPRPALPTPPPQVEIPLLIRQGQPFEPALRLPGVEALTLRARLWQPMIVEGRCVGALDLAGPEQDPFDADRQALIGTLCALAGLIYRGMLRREALQQARLDGEAAARAKGEFLATISHELRTPLNGIVGMSELLSETALDEEQVQMTEIIHSASNTLLTLINDLLDFSRLEAGQVRLRPTTFSPSGVIKTLCDRLAPQCAAKQLKLLCWVGPTVPALVHGDVHRLRQVISCLVDNAMKFTEQGHVWLSLEATPPDLDGTISLRCEVEDTGVGIDPARLDRVFQRFSQADMSLSRRFGGVGLGLALSQALLDLMGGEIGLLYTTPEVGSAFYFDLPLPMVAPPRPWPDLAGERICVVAPEGPATELLKRYIEQMGGDPWRCPLNALRPEERPPRAVVIHTRAEVDQLHRARLRARWGERTRWIGWGQTGHHLDATLADPMCAEAVFSAFGVKPGQRSAP